MCCNNGVMSCEVGDVRAGKVSGALHKRLNRCVILRLRTYRRLTPSKAEAEVASHWRKRCTTQAVSKMVVVRLVDLQVPRCCARSMHCEMGSMKTETSNTSEGPSPRLVSVVRNKPPMIPWILVWSGNGIGSPQIVVQSGASKRQDTVLCTYLLVCTASSTAVHGRRRQYQCRGMHQEHVHISRSLHVAFLALRNFALDLPVPRRISTGRTMNASTGTGSWLESSEQILSASARYSQADLLCICAHVQMIVRVWRQWIVAEVQL